MTRTIDGILEGAGNKGVLNQEIGLGHEHIGELSPEQDLVQYYSEAGPDYEAWSPNFNMHFGFFRKGMNPLNLESMLDAMNHEVMDQMGLDEGRVLDMGCGLGATTRTAAARFPRMHLDAVSLVPWQIERARELTEEAGLQGRVRFHLADYTATRFRDAEFQGIYAVESICHAQGPGKADALAEAARLLQPGGKLVIADGFLKKPGPYHPAFQKLCNRVSKDWSVETFAELPAFLESLKNQGFRDIRVRDISWRIAPSVLHVPLVSARFLARQLFLESEPMTRKRWGNVIAPLLGMILGLVRSHFGYYMITATR